MEVDFVCCSWSVSFCRLIHFYTFIRRVHIFSRCVCGCARVRAATWVLYAEFLKRYTALHSMDVTKNYILHCIPTKHCICVALQHITLNSSDITKHYITFQCRYRILHCVLLTWSNIIRPSSRLHWHEKTLHCISLTLHCISLTLHCISLTLPNTTVIIHFEVQQPFPVVWVTVAVRRSLPFDHLSRPCWYTKQHISQVLTVALPSRPAAD